MTSNAAFSLYGFNVSEKGHMLNDISIPFVVMNMAGAGLSFFLASNWSRFFQVWVASIIHEKESKGEEGRPIYHSFVVALFGSLFAFLVIWIMIEVYRHYRRTILSTVE